MAEMDRCEDRDEVGRGGGDGERGEGEVLLVK